MQSLNNFLAKYSQGPNQSDFLAVESILCTMPSDSIIVNGESPNAAESLVALALDEIAYGDEIPYESAPGFGVSSSNNSIVYRITYPSGSAPIYVITDSMSPA